MDESGGLGKPPDAEWRGLAKLFARHLIGTFPGNRPSPQRASPGGRATIFGRSKPRESLVAQLAAKIRETFGSEAAA